MASTDRRRTIPIRTVVSLTARFRRWVPGKIESYKSHREILPGSRWRAATKEVDPVSGSKTETTIDRATLYELVWSKPTAYLAQDYGLSDVGLGKICRAMNVPKPPRGYWAKVRRGYRMERPPLPPESDPSKAHVTITATIKKERPKAVMIDT